MGAAATFVLLKEARSGSAADDVAGLTADLDTLAAAAEPDALLLLATVQWHLRDWQASLRTLDGVEASAPHDARVLASARTIAGWVCLAQAHVSAPDAQGSDSDKEDEGDLGSSVDEAAGHFDALLGRDPDSLEVCPSVALLPLKLRRQAHSPCELHGRCGRLARECFSGCRSRAGPPTFARMHDESIAHPAGLPGAGTDRRGARRL